eukprot:2739084-Rhodomonas_salina.1
MRLMVRHPVPVVMVCPLDPRKVDDNPYFSLIRTQRTKGHVQPDINDDRKGRQGTESPWVESIRGLDGEARREAIKQKIREEVKVLTGEDDFSDDEPWGEMGLDSLSLVQLRSTLQREL